MTISSFFTYLIVLFVKIYQYSLSAFIGNSCRFNPTCSNYSIDAIKTHGPIYGTVLSLHRIFRCNPFCQGGCDPVPESNVKKSD